MKKLIYLFIIAFLFFPVKAQNQKKLTILHTNDLHSRLAGYGPESAYSPMTTGDDKTVGGFARIASILETEKEIDPEGTLILDAGDFLMGTIFQSMEVETGFQLRMMKKMGYDAVCLGNHEFDYGPEMLAGIINSSVKGGPVPSILNGNLVFADKDERDDSLEKIYAEKSIQRKLILTINGVKTGIFSLLGKSADDNAAFASPVTFSKQVRTARRFVKELKDENCDLIICLSHSGLTRNPDGTWGGEDAELARKVGGINVIISGHTHTLLKEPLTVNGIPIVQAGEYGQNVGKLEIEISDGKVTVGKYSVIPVDDKIAGDPEIHGLIEEQKKLVDNEILRRLRMSYDKPVAEAEFLMECNEYGNFKNSNLGPMVADAIYSYVNNNSSKGTDISMVAVGVIRDKVLQGIQSAPDIFRVMSMGTGKDKIPGYPLSRLYFTGKELKNILEILQIAYKSAPENYCFYSGIKVDFDPEKGLFKKIRGIEVINTDGTAKKVDFSPKNNTLYSVSANSYMLEFIGIIKKMSIGIINVVPKDSSGNRVSDMKNAIIDFDEDAPGLQEGKEWLAIMELIASMKDKNSNGIPEIDKKYSKPVKTFFEIR